MPGHRTQHNLENIKREISAIIRELKDPRVNESFISIVKIDMSEDSSSCRVYISSLDGIENAKEAVKGLDSAKGYIRKQIGSRLRLRYVPAIIFSPTDSIEYGINIMKTLNELKEKSDNEISKSDSGDNKK